MNTYLVTHGDYSDYTVDGVFSTKEKAEEYVATYEHPRAFNYGPKFRIEEHSLDPTLTKELTLDVCYTVNGNQSPREEVITILQELREDDELNVVKIEKSKYCNLIYYSVIVKALTVKEACEKAEKLIMNAFEREKKR